MVEVHPSGVDVTTRVLLFSDDILAMFVRRFSSQLAQLKVSQYLWYK